MVVLKTENIFLYNLARRRQVIQGELDFWKLNKKVKNSNWARYCIFYKPVKLKLEKILLRILRSTYEECSAIKVSKGRSMGD